MDSTVIGILVIVFLVGYAVFGVTYREKAGRKNAQSGEDKARVQALLRKALPEEGDFTPLYVHMDVGRHTVTHYIYAVAVQPELDRLWVVPVGKEGDTLYPGKPFLLTLEQVGSIYFNVSSNRDIGSRLSTADFYDSQRKRIFRLEVKDFECRESRFHWLNVCQTEEASVYFRMMEKWAAQKPMDTGKKK